MNDWYDKICDFLRIEAPKIRRTALPGTMLARYDSDGNVLNITDKDVSEYDMIFCVAHELRHAWQVKTDPDAWLSDYKHSNESDTIDNYNVQPAEIDAHAFAAIVLQDMFNRTPLFNGLSDYVKEKIWKRSAEIREQNKR